MTNCVLRAPVQFRQRRLKFAIGPSRHFVAKQQLSRFRSEVEISEQRLPNRIYEYAP
jgi:hypothetical protein